MDPLLPKSSLNARVLLELAPQPLCVFLAPEGLASDLWIDPAAYPHIPYPPELKVKEVLLPTSEYHCMRRYPLLVHVIHSLVDPAIGIYGRAQMPCALYPSQIITGV